VNRIRENKPIFGRTGENNLNFGKPRTVGSGKPSQKIEVFDLQENTMTYYNSINEAARACPASQAQISTMLLLLCILLEINRIPVKGDILFKSYNCYSCGCEAGPLLSLLFLKKIKSGCEAGPLLLFAFALFCFTLFYARRKNQRCAAIQLYGAFICFTSDATFWFHFVITFAFNLGLIIKLNLNLELLE
jgi:hypothetical protein